MYGLGEGIGGDRIYLLVDSEITDQEVMNEKEA